MRDVLITVVPLKTSENKHWFASRLQEFQTEMIQEPELIWQERVASLCFPLENVTGRTAKE